MPSSVGYPTLSARVISDEEIQKFRAICDENKFSYSMFASIILKDVLSQEEMLKIYIAKAQQFEDDQAPATIAEMKDLRAQLRQQEEELAQLRSFKEQALNDVAEYRNNVYTR